MSAPTLSTPRVREVPKTHIAVSAAIQTLTERGEKPCPESLAAAARICERQLSVVLDEMLQEGDLIKREDLSKELLLRVEYRRVERILGKETTSMLSEAAFIEEYRRLYGETITHGDLGEWKSEGLLTLAWFKTGEQGTPDVYYVEPGPSSRHIRN